MIKYDVPEIPIARERPSPFPPRLHVAASFMVAQFPVNPARRGRMRPGRRRE